MTTSPGAKERAQSAASTAAEEGRHVAGAAAEGASNVASEAATQAKNLVGEAMTQVSEQLTEQSRTQRDRVTGTLRTLGDDLEKMASGSGSGLATDLAREVAQRTRALSDHLENREPGELLEDVRHFARQRPGAFLLGALAAGMVAGRVFRGAADGVAGAAAMQSRTPEPMTTAPPVTPPSSTTTPVADTSTGLGTPVGTPTTNPPTPSAMPGQPTTGPAGSTGSALDPGGPMGTDTAGYGERGSYGEGSR